MLKMVKKGGSSILRFRFCIVNSNTDKSCRNRRENCFGNRQFLFLIQSFGKLRGDNVWQYQINADSKKRTRLVE